MHAFSGPCHIHLIPHHQFVGGERERVVDTEGLEKNTKPAKREGAVYEKSRKKEEYACICIYRLYKHDYTYIIDGCRYHIQQAATAGPGVVATAAPLISPRGEGGATLSWLRTNGVNTHGAAAKVMNFVRLGKKVRPGTSGNIKVD